MNQIKIAVGGVLSLLLLYGGIARADDAACFPGYPPENLEYIKPGFEADFREKAGAIAAEFRRRSKLLESPGYLETQDDPRATVDALFAAVDKDLLAKADCFRGYVPTDDNPHHEAFAAAAARAGRPLAPRVTGTELADRFHAMVDPERAPLFALVAKELACRADAKCMLPRQVRAVTASVCAVQGEREYLVQRMAAERSNPSHVVDLVELHDDGMSLQDIDRNRLPPAKAGYLQITKKAFSRTVCLPLWEAQAAAEGT